MMNEISSTGQLRTQGEVEKIKGSENGVEGDEWVHGGENNKAGKCINHSPQHVLWLKRGRQRLKTGMGGLVNNYLTTFA